jgi:hypothetical protein
MAGAIFGEFAVPERFRRIPGNSERRSLSTPSNPLTGPWRSLMRRRHPLPAISLLLLCGAGAAHAQATDGTLPIRRVVLYKHGVAYFEREGKVDGDVTVRLSFPTDAMSDVLKSLTAFDRSGGAIDAIAYDSMRPPAEQLAEIGIDVPQEDVRRQALLAFRGARVHARIAARGVISGAILGVEMRPASSEKDAPQVPHVLLLDDDAAWIAFPLADLEQLDFEDPLLDADFERYFDRTLRVNDRDARAVDLVCRGEGERSVFAAYSVGHPVFKAAYRLVLRDEGKPPLLQGYAIVDNPTAEDWTDVELSLVAGMPVAFRHDLYTTRRVERPRLDPRGAGESESAITTIARGAGGPATGGGAVLAKKKSAAAPPPSAAIESKIDARIAAYEAIAAQSEARDVGDLREYVIDHPVTIAANRSAMLPIVAAPVDGARVAYYDARRREDHPFAAIHLVNGSGSALEAGPITLLELGTYLGEAWLDSMQPAEKRYVSYAVDLAVQAESALESMQRQIHRAYVREGVLFCERTQVEKRTYRFVNRDAKPRRVVIEHVRRDGFALESPATPLEKELDRYRFAIELEARGNGELVVVETKDTERAYPVSEAAEHQLLALHEQGAIDEAMLTKLRELITRERAASALKDVIAQLDSERSRLAVDQKRVRENLRSLRRTSEEKELVRTYVQSLDADEQRIVAIALERAGLEAELAAAEARVDAWLAELATEFGPESTKKEG